jgi:hypothetical protein
VLTLPVLTMRRIRFGVDVAWRCRPRPMPPQLLRLHCHRVSCKSTARERRSMWCGKTATCSLRQPADACLECELLVSVVEVRLSQSPILSFSLVGSAGGRCRVSRARTYAFGVFVDPAMLRADGTLDEALGRKAAAGGAGGRFTVVLSIIVAMNGDAAHPPSSPSPPRMVMTILVTGRRESHCEWVPQQRGAAPARTPRGGRRYPHPRGHCRGRGSAGVIDRAPGAPRVQQG